MKNNLMVKFNSKPVYNDKYIEYIQISSTIKSQKIMNIMPVSLQYY